MSNDETAIAIISSVVAIERAKRYSDIVRVMQSDGVLRKGSDYGVIPGTNKPTLFKPGAERLCAAFGLSPEFELINSIENWGDDDALFHYQYRCNLVHIESGKLIATGIGSCNSKESKYRWRWLWDNEVIGVDTTDMATRKTRKGSTQYRAENDDVFSIVNTIDKMAQKRALIAAVLIGCNASGHFTQDIEDIPGFGTDIIDGEFSDVVESETPPVPEAPPAEVSWPSSEKVSFVMGWFRRKGLVESEIFRLAGVTAIDDGDGWRKYADSKDAIKGIQAAFDAELDGKTDQPMPEQSSMFKYMSYVGKTSNLVFCTEDNGGGIVATLFEGRAGICKWSGNELYTELDLAQYDKIKGKNIMSDFIPMVVPVEFLYTSKNGDNGEIYFTITGIKGDPVIPF